jgi:crotonobetainyl-CoA hydratase
MRFDCDKPIIAAVNGVAMGGGFEVALACDLIIASDNATFALPEPRVGLAALAGGLQRLPRQIGLKRAMGMILTARHVSAKEGLELGFVNEVVPQNELMATAERWAETICKNSPMSVRASKQAIQKGLAVPLEQAMTEQREYPAVKAMTTSQDYIEGPKAFSEKRPPKWLGR